MSIFLLFCFLIGFSVPYISRYISKSYPCTMAYLLWSAKGYLSRKKYPYSKYPQKGKELIKELFLYSLVLGVLFSGFSLVLYSSFSYVMLLVMLFFFYIFALISEVDKRFFVIPDMLSFILIIFAFLLVYMNENSVNTSDYSVLLNRSITGFFASNIFEAVGAGLYGYLISVVAALFFYRSHPEGFGGGDVKLLSILGILLGLDNLSIVIGVSFVMFFIAYKMKGVRSFAYAPFAFSSVVLLLIFKILF